MEKPEDIDYKVEISAEIKRWRREPPRNKWEEIEDAQIQSKINLFAKQLAIEIEDRLNGKSVKRLPEPITIDIRDLD